MVSTAVVGSPLEESKGVTLFVKQGGTSVTCEDWFNACDLQTALSIAGSGNEVWVAAGTYVPILVSAPSPEKQNISFILESGVAIYGGFPADGGDWSSRDWVANPTILSGDIGTPEDNTDNSYHVVTGQNVDNTGILDGFTITAANRRDGGESGGMYLTYSNPTLQNLIIKDNWGFYHGGGLYNDNSNPTLTNITFLENRLRISEIGYGGGLYNNASSPILSNVNFSGNFAGQNSGGGMANVNNSHPELTNVTFMNNVGSFGAGMYNLDSNPTLTNVTFSENDASGNYGGAIYNDNSNPSLTNVTIYKNRALRGSGLFNTNNSAPTLVNSIIWANIDHEYNPNDQIYNEASTTTITYSIIQGGYTGMGNMDVDPLLEELSYNAGLTQSHALYLDSPAIDAGSAANCPARDQRWYSRPFDGDRNGIAACDMGAYEIHLDTWYVKSDGTSTSCDSWENACSDLQIALSLATPGDQVWVAEGMYKPDNSDLNATFQLESEVEIYGGFEGGETGNDQRNWKTNLTVLSGDIGTLGEDTDNSYHVVTGSGVASTGILDGFVIRDGYAFGPELNAYGGGMYNLNGSPTLTNLILTENKADSGGGGMYNEGSNPFLKNIEFTKNTVYVSGAGMANYNSSPHLMMVSFIENSTGDSGSGGGMSNLYSHPVLNDVTFTDNYAGKRGGGLYNSRSNPTLTNVSIINNSLRVTGGTNGAGIYNVESNPTLTNVTISGNKNQAGGGGGIYNLESIPILNNVTIVNNIAPHGGAIANENPFGNMTIRNSIISGENAVWTTNVFTITFEYSLIQGGCPDNEIITVICSNSIYSDPLLEPIADNGGFTQTHALGDASPAIDAGDPDPLTCPATDQRGYIRPIDGDLDEISRCDIGAYEYGSYPYLFIYLPFIQR